MPVNLNLNLHRAVKQMDTAKPDQLVHFQNGLPNASSRMMSAKQVEADRAFVKETLAHYFSMQLCKSEAWSEAVDGSSREQVNRFIEAAIDQACPIRKQVTVASLCLLDNIARNMQRDGALARAVIGDGIDAQAQFNVKMANKIYEQAPPPKVREAPQISASGRRCFELPALHPRTGLTTVVKCAGLGAFGGALLFGTAGWFAATLLTGDPQWATSTANVLGAAGAVAGGCWASSGAGEGITLADAMLGQDLAHAGQERAVWNSAPGLKLMKPEDLPQALDNLFNDGQLPELPIQSNRFSSVALKAVHLRRSISQSYESSAIALREIANHLETFERLETSKQRSGRHFWPVAARLLTSVRPEALFAFHLQPPVLAGVISGASFALIAGALYHNCQFDSAKLFNAKSLGDLAPHLRESSKWAGNATSLRWFNALYILECNSRRLARFLDHGKAAILPESNGRSICELIEDFEENELADVIAAFERQGLEVPAYLQDKELSDSAEVVRLSLKDESAADSMSQHLFHAGNPQPDAQGVYEQARKAERRAQTGRANERKAREPQTAVIHLPASPTNELIGHQKGQQARHKFLGTVHHDRSTFKRLSNRERALYNPTYDCGMAIARRRQQDKINAGRLGDGVKIHTGRPG